MITLSIPAPDLWLNANSRMHWSKRARLTREWRQAACWRARAARLPRLTGQVEITATVHRDTRRGRSDAANRMPTVKAAIDGVVDAGLIRDDSDRFVRSLTIVAGDVTSTPGGLLILTITPVPESSRELRTNFATGSRRVRDECAEGA